MSCHGFSKYSISTVILTCRSSIVTYYIYKVFVIVETEEVGLYNIPISVKNQINADGLHTEDILLTWKASIPSIVSTLNKIIIPTDIYDTYVYNFYYDHSVTFYNPGF